MPSTQYTRRDGLHIGYQVWGDGERDILDLGFGTYISIDEAAEQIRWRRYSERLAGCGRLIRFDPIGIGLSDAPDRLDQLTYDNWVRDAVCVLDAVGSARAVVLAASSSTLAALVFASQHPDRTESLVLINGTARYVEDDDYAIGVPVSLIREFQAGLDPDRPDEVSEDLNDLRLFAPSGVGDPEFEQWWSRASRRGATPATAAALASSPPEPTSVTCCRESAGRRLSCTATAPAPRVWPTASTWPIGFHGLGWSRFRATT